MKSIVVIERDGKFHIYYDMEGTLIFIMSVDSSETAHYILNGSKILSVN